MNTPLRQALASLAFIACASSDPPTGGTEESPDTELRVGAKMSVSGLILGKYINDVASEGQLVSLQLEARTLRTARDVDGIWSGTIRKGSTELAIKGGFTVVRKRIPMPSYASGHDTRNVLKLIDSSGAVVHEGSFSYVDNTLAYYDFRKHTEQLLDLVQHARGGAPFSLECTLTKLHDDNVFEEGLSKDEYPAISLVEVDGKLVIDIGASSFDGNDGESIIVASRSGLDIDATIDLGGGYQYRVAVKAKEGIIQAIANGTTKRVADFTCR